MADFALAGIPFTERWARFDESVAALRALWDPDVPPFVGRHYDTSGVTLRRHRRSEGTADLDRELGVEGGPGRVARLADGWLASGYNSTPETFAAAWLTLSEMLEAEGRDPLTVPSRGRPPG